MRLATRLTPHNDFQHLQMFLRPSKRRGQRQVIRALRMYVRRQRSRSRSGAGRGGGSDSANSLRLWRTRACRWREPRESRHYRDE